MTNRIEDLIEKARHYEDLWHEALDENKRLRNAGDAMELLISYSGIYIDGSKSGLLKAWNAAKEGENK